MVTVACLIPAAIICAAAICAMVSSHKDQEYVRFVVGDVSARITQLEKTMFEDRERMAALRRAMMRQQMREPPVPGKPLPGLPGSP